jgi:ComF family protein
VRLTDVIARILFPRRCVFCKTVLNIDYDDYICTECAERIEKISGNVCEKCGVPIVGVGRCRNCNSQEHQFDKGYAVYVYEGEIRATILRFKYNNKGGYARFFGRELAKYAEECELPRVDYVVPIPIHKDRLRKRGYNQSLLVAEVYCKERGECCAALLERTGKTKPQSGLSKTDRAKNVKNAFAISDKSISIKGKSILLIDDIFTTGSTVDECARVLKKAGADKVYSLCLSIDRKD